MICTRCNGTGTAPRTPYDDKVDREERFAAKVAQTESFSAYIDDLFAERGPDLAVDLLGAEPARDDDDDRVEPDRDEA